MSQTTSLLLQEEDFSGIVGLAPEMWVGIIAFVLLSSAIGTYFSPKQLQETSHQTVKHVPCICRLFLDALHCLASLCCSCHQSDMQLMHRGCACITNLA